jgi:hypothetical protein
MNLQGHQLNDGMLAWLEHAVMNPDEFFPTNFQRTTADAAAPAI